jgi:hypothetical protein
MVSALGPRSSPALFVSVASLGQCPLPSEVSTTLNIAADEAYEIFADPTEIPRWLPMLQTARTLARCDEGLARRVAFTRRLDRGSIGYTLEYRYDPAKLSVAWSTPEGSNIVLTGEAQFIPLSANACLMLYRLIMDLPIVDKLTQRELETHPASHVVAEFREYVRWRC